MVVDLCCVPDHYMEYNICSIVTHTLYYTCLQYHPQCSHTLAVGVTSPAYSLKMDSGMAAFRDGEEDVLCVVAGWGPTPTCRQPGAQYKADGDDRFLCN